MYALTASTSCISQYHILSCAYSLLTSGLEMQIQENRVGIHVLGDDDDSTFALLNSLAHLLHAALEDSCPGRNTNGDGHNNS